MAISSVSVMVKDVLPYLTDDALIERIRVQMTYLLQPQLNKTDLEVEDEANYTAMQNMLFAQMVAYHLLHTKAIETMAGDGTNSGSASKTLKKAKADVVETEFVVTKASDGALIQVETVVLMQQIKSFICSYSGVLKISNPLCYDPKNYHISPQFVIHKSPGTLTGQNPEPLTGTIG